MDIPKRFGIQAWRFTALWFCLSGFSLAPAIIPIDQILSGGPPKNGIPALTNPTMDTARAADQWLKDDDMVLGIVIRGKARAYPIRILNWHEIVNDQIGKTRIVISYCPLCGSGMAFDTQDQFGVSGMLYQSDVLLYDKRSESLWSQLMMQAVAGARSGEKLHQFPITHSTWQMWKTAHPNSRVLSRRTGYARDYSRNPYAGYALISRTYFPVNHQDSRLHAKTWVIGLSLGKHHIAWPLDSLIKAGSHSIPWHGHQLHITVNGQAIEIHDRQSGQILPGTRLYWFAWSAFHPDTELSSQ